jgi:hypothetical protein
MEISLNKLEDEVHISVIFSDANCTKSHDIRVFAQFKQNADFPQGPYRIYRVDEGIIYLFYSYSLSICLINSFPDGPVSTSAHFLNEIVLCVDNLIHVVPGIHVDFLPFRLNVFSSFINLFNILSRFQLHKNVSPLLNMGLRPFLLQFCSLFFFPCF